MSDEPKQPRRGIGKNGKPFKADNTREDGSYKIGKNRTSEATRFRKGDGRRRGRREKGVPNYETVFLTEATRKVTVTVNGKTRRMSQAEVTSMRLFEKANAKGHFPSIAFIQNEMRRIDERRSSKPTLNASDDELVEGFMRDRLEMLARSEGEDAAPEPSAPDEPEVGDGEH